MLIATVFHSGLWLASLFYLGEIRDAHGDVVTGLWDHFYLAIVTITTLGYGNLVPHGWWAEFVATIGAVLGFAGFAIISGIFIALMLAQLISSDDT